MILSTAEKLKQKVNAPTISNPALDERCGVLLQAATNYLQSYLNTNFDLESVEDVFCLRAASFKARTKIIRLELSNCFVVGEIDCKTAASYYNLARDEAVTEVDELDYVVERDIGRVKLPEWRAEGQYVQIDYDKGFLTEVDPTTGLPIAIGIPEWLEEAALITAAYHYLLPTIESTEELCHGLPCEARQLLDPYRRNWQDAYQVGV